MWYIIGISFPQIVVTYLLFAETLSLAKNSTSFLRLQ